MSKKVKPEKVKKSVKKAKPKISLKRYIEVTSFEQGDFAYLVLDGRKVQVVSVNQGVYLVRYADNNGHLEKISLSHFELTDDYELRQTLR